MAVDSSSSDVGMDRANGVRKRSSRGNVYNTGQGPTLPSVDCCTVVINAAKCSYRQNQCITERARESLFCLVVVETMVVVCPTKEFLEV